MKNSLNILHLQTSFKKSCGISRYIRTLMSSRDSRLKHYALFLETDMSKAETGKFDGIYFFSKNMLLPSLLSNLIELKGFCKQHKIDVIHTHHRYMDLLGYMFKKLSGIPVVTSVHSMVEGKKNLSYKNRPVIAVSKAVKSHLIEKFSLKAEEVAVLTNPINPNEFSFDTNVFKIRSNKVIAYIGRISTEKGIEVLLKAFEKIRHAIPDAELHIAGEGDKSSYLREYITAGNQSIVYHGPVMNPGEIYKTADVIVLPSLVDSFPYGMLEAGCFGKMFIGSETGGMQEYITDGYNGMLFPAGDSDALAEKVCRALAESDMRVLMGSRLHKKVLEENSLPQYTEKLAAIYYGLTKK